MQKAEGEGHRHDLPEMPARPAQPGDQQHGGQAIAQGDQQHRRQFGDPELGNREVQPPGEVDRDRRREVDRLQEAASSSSRSVSNSNQRSSAARSEEHTSELQSLMRISYAVFCLKKHTNTTP